MAVPELPDDGGDHAGLVHEERRHHQVLQGHLISRRDGLDQLLGGQDADDVVDGILIDRDAGILHQLVRQFGNAVVIVNGAQVHPGREHLHGHGVGDLDGGADQLAFLLGKDALLFDIVHQLHQFLGGHVRGILLGRPQMLKMPHQLFHHVHHGLENKHGDLHGVGEDAGQGVGHAGGHDLGQGLAEDQQQGRHDRGGDGRAVGQVQGLDEQHGGRGGRGDIGQVVAHQDGGQGADVVVDDVQFQLGHLFAFLRRLFHPVAVGLGIGDLRGGKEGGQQDQYRDQKA